MFVTRFFLLARLRSLLTTAVTGTSRILIYAWVPFVRVRDSQEGVLQGSREGVLQGSREGVLQGSQQEEGHRAVGSGLGDPFECFVGVVPVGVHVM